VPKPNKQEKAKAEKVKVMDKAFQVMREEPLVVARDVLKMNPYEMLKTLPKAVHVQYDDGTISRSTTRKLVYSWFIWEFHRRYPVLVLTHAHHVDSVLNGEMLSSNTHIELLGRISKELILNYGYQEYDQKEDILELIYFITNQIHNELPKMAGRYVTTLCITDILEIAHDARILELKRKLQPTTKSMEDFYQAARKIIMEDPKYRRNNLVQLIRMKILNMNQVNQCLLARGFPIEVTGQILSTPIMSCYAEGMYKLYDYVAESRGAAKHLYAAEAPLQDTEYFARRLQLAGMVVTGVTKGDCGTDRHLPWLVKPPKFTETGRMTYQGDLKFMKGKLYLDEDTKQLKEITGKERHLDGRIINIRSVLFCREPDQHKVCATCFGMLHHNVSRFANLGHLCDATLTQQSTQTILSTKHLIGSAIGTDILLKADARNYLTFFYNTMSFNLNKMGEGSKIKLIVPRGTAVGLTDLKLLKSIDQINARRISALTEIAIEETLPDGTKAPPVVVPIEQNKQSGYFSAEFLRFLWEKGWKVNESDHFVLDLTGWNYRLPMIRVPDVEYSYAQHADQIANLIESNTKKLHSRAQADAPSQVLQELFDLVNSKIDVNIALLEVMIYAVMTPGVDNYGMARNQPGAGLHVSRNVIQNRSLAPAYAYENQFGVISHPRSFFMENRPDSPIDVFMNPKEVVQHLHAMKETGPGLMRT